MKLTAIFISMHANRLSLHRTFLRALWVAFLALYGAHGGSARARASSPLNAAGIGTRTCEIDGLRQFHPGDDPDGVVEAQKPDGELIGFERMAAISSQSTEQIAEAAQTFGQEDDITVLTLTLVSPEVVHA